jgi:dipeptidyl aminopeptidase/acylaminoacyl peptidase
MKSILKIMISQIVMPFKRLSDPKLLTQALDISASMAGNAYFPTPTPPLADVDDAIAAFQKALNDAANRDRSQVILKNRARVELISLLTALGNYVTFTSDGNSAMIGSTAFPTRKVPQPIIVTKPTVRVELGANSGELISIAEGVKKNRGYYHKYAPDPLTENSVWESFPSSSKKYTFIGLERAKIYWCRVAVVGSKGQLVFSDPVSKVVQ